MGKKSATADYELVGGAPVAASHCRVRSALLLSALAASLCAAYALFYRSPPAAGGPDCSSAALTLSASPSHVTDGGDLVVSWAFASLSGAACNASREDFLTLSCGPVSGDHDYFQRRNVSDADATPTSVRFADLYMMRCTYVVKYFAAARGAQPAAELRVSTRDAPSAPKHGHLAFSARDDEMVVMFNSASRRTPRVRFGVRPELLALEASGASTTYAAADMCHEPATTTSQLAFRDPGFMHTVVLSGLLPDQLYFYRFGNDADGWSRVQSFRSKPPPGARTAKFIAYGDMGVDSAPAAQSTAVRVFEDVVGDGYDAFLLHVGDVSYARGKAHVWDKFFHLIEPIATRVPYMVSIGNHEYDYTSGGAHDPSGGAGPSGTGFHPSWGNYGADSGGECAVPMVHRWHAPATGNGLFWYSFDYAGIHVVQLSSEHNWTRGSTQFEWLAADLARVNRTTTPWVIVTAHRMMYTTQIDGGECTVNQIARHMREELEELLHASRVNLMLVGHQHAYERSCPVYKGACVEDGKGTVHVLAGAAGYEIDTTAFSAACGNWSQSHVNAYGHLRVAVGPERMQLQFVLNANGAVYDEATVSLWEEE